jgi:hypothetical protein
MPFSLYFDHFMLLHMDYEILVVSELGIEPIKQPSGKLLLAIGWNAYSSLGHFRYETDDPFGREYTIDEQSRLVAAIRQWETEHPAVEARWQQILSASNALSSPALSESGDDISKADPPLPVIATTSSSPDDNDKVTPSITELGNRNAQECSTCAARLAATAATDSPASVLDAAAEVSDGLLINVVPRLYHLLEAVILLICYLLVCGYLLDRGWSIYKSFIHNQSAFDRGFEVHATFEELQAEIQFIHSVLFAVLVVLYFKL